MSAYHLLPGEPGCYTYAYRILSAICIMLTCGCGGREYDVVPVSGRVTLDGKPMADVQVSFQPAAVGTKPPNPGPGSFGITDADGRFTLRTVKPRYDGAVIGTHIVRMTTAHQQDDPVDVAVVSVDTVLPPQCRNGSIRFEVPPNGTDQANFDLTSK